MWRKVRRVLGIMLAVVVAGIGGLYAYVQLTCKRDFSATPLPTVKASTDLAVIAQGAYLVHSVAHCSGCHVNAEFAMKPIKALPDPKDLRGGAVIKAGPFGTYYPANLTPDPETGIGKLSDGELARIIRAGVAPDGRLDAFMKFSVGPMADEDLIAIMSYLRSLPSVKNTVPKDEWGFVAKALAGKFDPNTRALPKYVPAGGVAASRGEYLANGPANCFGCHTPVDPMKGFAESGPRFSGGAEAEPDEQEEGFEIMPPNLTPDPETGVLNAHTEETFVDRFTKGGRVHKGSHMPWENFAQMTPDDLKSIFAYLRSLPPTKHVTGPSRRKQGWKPGKT